MALEQSTFKIGGTTFPLAITGNTLLQDCDPVIYNLLNFYRAILNKYLGARWVSETNLSGFTNQDGYVINDFIPYDPSPYFQQDQYKFPLVAIYRTDEQIKDITRYFYHMISNIKILFALPPLTAAEMEQISPFIRSVVKVIIEKTKIGYDVDYNNNEQVFEVSGIEEISINAVSYGNLPSPKSLEVFFPAAQISLTIKERREIVPGAYDDADGIDGEVQITDEGNENPLTVIEYEQDF